MFAMNVLSLFAAVLAVSAVPGAPDASDRSGVQTKILVRSQLKYGLERTDYLHRWYERPLHQDSTYAVRAPNGSQFINALSWRKQVEIARLSKIDGFGVFLNTHRREDVLPRSVEPGGEMTILVEMHAGDEAAGVEHCVEMAGRALAMPNSFRIDGKVVLTRYPEITAEKPQALDFYPVLKKALDEKYGKDRFALMPYAVPLRRRDSPIATPAAVERTKECIRRILRRTDGLYYTLTAGGGGVDRRFDAHYHDTVFAPIVKSVMAEPEFKGKLLGIGVRQAHENVCRWTYGIDSTGTRLLRDSMASVALMRPDFILCPEWDEQNENTHFRPITSNGHVTQRILRYWADVYAGRPPEPFPGDDVSIPNLVVSYRKSLQAGQLAEVEVCNIPDGTAKAARYSVSFRWKTPDGKVMREWPAQDLDMGKNGAVWFNCPVADLLAAHVLLPELTVAEGDAPPKTFGCGMWPLSVEANRNLDFKWVKNALREIDSGVEGSLVASPPRADGTVEVKGRVRGRRKFRNIEVLDCFDTVYMHDTSAKAPSGGDCTIRIAYQGCSGAQGRLQGEIAVGGDSRAIDDEFSSRSYELFYRVPKAEVENAVVRVRLKGIFEKEIPVREVIARGRMSFAGPQGFTFVAARCLYTYAIPPPCGVDAAEFSFVMKPMNRLSVLRLRTIDEDFRIWTSPAPVDFYRPSGKERVFHICEQAPGNLVKGVRVDAARCVEAEWKFADDPSRNAIVELPGFFDMPCVFGGSVALANGFGRGENTYGSAISTSRVAPPSPYAFATMPMQAIPMYAGFELTLKVRPRDVAKPATLVTSGPNGFVLSQTPKGVAAYFSLGNMHYLPRPQRKNGDSVTGPALRAGEWNTVKVFYDQHEAWIEVNGESGPRKPFSGWQFGPSIGGLGVMPGKTDYYPGEFGELSVRLL
jgi:hypothetical protein